MNNTSIAGMKRTHMCGDLRLEHAGQTVTVNGWVDRVRDNGGVLFLLLRDRAGIVQCTFDKSVNADLFDIAFTCRTEFVVAVKLYLLVDGIALDEVLLEDRSSPTSERGRILTVHPIANGYYHIQVVIRNFTKNTTMSLCSNLCIFCTS